MFYVVHRKGCTGIRYVTEMLKIIFFQIFKLEQDCKYGRHDGKAGDLFSDDFINDHIGISE